MKKSSLKRIAVSTRRVLDSVFGSAEPQLCFEAFFRSTVRLYLTENGFIPFDETRRLTQLMPQIFPQTDCEEKIRFGADNAVEILSEIPSETLKNGVQIIGQLYQYFISEDKEAALGGMKKNHKVAADSLPATTQIFTPDWIVRYMVENTLGKALAGCCGADTSGMEYFVQGEEPVSEGDPEDITFLDPCAGSGNILIYAFDMFMKLYLARGYDREQAAVTVLERNLFGLDIDSRVCRIARFALTVKAAEQSRRLLFDGISPQIYDMEGLSEGDGASSGQFAHSEIFGSLIRPELKPEVDSKAARIYELLTRRYSAVVTNPPYLSGARMNPELLSFLKSEYSDHSADLFSAFIVRCCELTEEGGYAGFLTPYVWMFISSYRRLRELLFGEKTPLSLVQFEYSSFEEATVPVCAFVLRNCRSDEKGVYFRLTDFKGGLEVQRQQFLKALDDRNCGYVYEASAADFGKLPESPAAYWISDRVRSLYSENPSLGSISAPRKGNSTSDNERFLRYWYEVAYEKINIGCKRIDREETRWKRWFPYNKGGGFRKWYGFNEYITDWYDDAAEIRAIPTAVIANYRYFMKEGLTWSTLTSGKFSIRQFGEGYIFDNGGCCIFELGERRNFICGLLNSKVFAYIFGQLNPTLNFQSGEVAKFPVILKKSKDVDRLVEECVAISRAEYDSFEISRDFIRHPLI